MAASDVGWWFHRQRKPFQQLLGMVSAKCWLRGANQEPGRDCSILAVVDALKGFSGAIAAVTLIGDFTLSVGRDRITLSARAGTTEIAEIT